MCLHAEVPLITIQREYRKVRVASMQCHEMTEARHFGLGKVTFMMLMVQKSDASVGEFPVSLRSHISQLPSPISSINNIGFL